jgi:hypothetical protein
MAKVSHISHRQYSFGSRSERSFSTYTDEFSHLTAQQAQVLRDFCQIKMKPLFDQVIKVEAKSEVREVVNQRLTRRSSSKIWTSIAIPRWASTRLRVPNMRAGRSRNVHSRSDVTGLEHEQDEGQRESAKYRSPGGLVIVLKSTMRSRACGRQGRESFDEAGAKSKGSGSLFSNSS